MEVWRLVVGFLAKSFCHSMKSRPLQAATQAASPNDTRAAISLPPGRRFDSHAIGPDCVRDQQRPVKRQQANRAVRLLGNKVLAELLLGCITPNL